MTLPTNFSKRYLPRLVGLVCAFFLLFLSLWNPVFINELRLKAYDVLLRLDPAPTTSDANIVIVDIDDPSLAALGQWPWPRSLWAEILTTIGQGDPRAVGLDIVFAEPDRSSPKMVLEALDAVPLSDNCRQQLASLPDHDHLLAKALKDQPVVLGFPFSFTTKSTEPLPTVPGPNRFALIGADPTTWLFQAQTAAFNLKDLETAAAGSGFFNILPDADGIIRRVPLVLQYGETIYPSLALEMLRIGQKIPLNYLYSEGNGLGHVSCGHYDIPTDAFGQLNIRYCGRERSFFYVSIIDIISGQIEAEFFRDAYVLIGTSAPGLVDIVTTPTSAVFPGVEVHAHALNTILTAAYLHEPDWAKGAEFCYLLFLSFTLIILVPMVGALRGGLVLFTGSSAILLFSGWCFRNGYYLDPAYPLLSTVILFSSLSSINYFLEERVRQQTRNIFSKYVSPALVEELLKTPGKINLRGEERVLTALFSDIRDFSRISESLTPEEVCSSLNQYLTVMTKILMDNQGTVDKFIGDAIFAFWNAPLYDDEHADNALTAALAMRDGLAELSRDWQEQDMPLLKVGIGIHTGPVRIGNIGSENRLSYTAIGDNINLTSRLEGVTKQYGVPIIVSAATWKLADKKKFVFCKLDRIRVVGRQEAVTIFELLDFKEQVPDERLVAIKAYEDALESYFNGNFAIAEEKFRQLPKGAYARLQDIFITRCRDHLTDPDAPAWDGVNVLEVK